MQETSHFVGFAAAAILAMAATPSGAFEPQFHPTVEVSPAVGLISIDGNLDDDGWRGAAVADNFAEVMPGDQIEPPVKSEAWITYDSNNLYVALIAYDDPNDVRVSIRERDDIFSDDYFGIMLDTYGDLKWGYEFFVNPIGIQGDLRTESSGNEEIGFDLVWYSEGQVTDDGYQVEIAIPFSSLRFLDTPEQSWRINFWRDHQRDQRRRYAWSAINRDDPCWMCQWGHLTGIENIEPSSNLDVIAGAVGFQDGTLETDEDGNYTDTFDNDKVDGSASVNVRYGFTPSTSGELAVNPDFSQIESDAVQIDINDPFALFFPERRPFFQEGSDLYETWIDAIYTRSIVDPFIAGKGSGQVGSSRWLYLLAHDEKSQMLVPLAERTEAATLGKSWSNIARFQQSLADDAHIGAIFTDRRHVDGFDGSGTVASIDTRLRLMQNLSLEIQGATSYTVEPDDSTLLESDETFGGAEYTAALDGESYWGEGVYTSLERGARLWSSDIDYRAYSPTFRTENGFMTRNDYRQVSWWNGLHFRPNGETLIQWQPSLSFGRIWNYDGQFREDWISPHIWFDLLYQTHIECEYFWGRERYRGVQFDDIQEISIFASNRYRNWIQFSAEADYGKTIRRAVSPELGNNFDVTVDATIRPTQRFRLETAWAYSEMERRDEPEPSPTGYRGLHYAGWVARARLGYNFTREWSFRFVCQFDNFDDSQRRNSMSVEPLLTYKHNPFTVFYLGWTSGIADLEGRPQPGESKWTKTDRRIFAKVQYLWRI